MVEDFPFLIPPSTSSSTELPTFKMYAWDFDKNEFEKDAYGNMIVLEGDDALKIWITKTLMTERYHYLAYSWAYGSEIKEKFMARVMGIGERKSELKRGIIETLMVNPYIKSVDSITFDEDKHNRIVKVNIIITSIYGKIYL